MQKTAFQYLYILVSTMHLNKNIGGSFFGTELLIMTSLSHVVQRCQTGILHFLTPGTPLDSKKYTIAFGTAGCMNLKNKALLRPLLQHYKPPEPVTSHNDLIGDLLHEPAFL